MPGTEAWARTRSTSWMKKNSYLIWRRVASENDVVWPEIPTSGVIRVIMKEIGESCLFPGSWSTTCARSLRRTKVVLLPAAAGESALRRPAQLRLLLRRRPPSREGADRRCARARMAPAARAIPRRTGSARACRPRRPAPRCSCPAGAPKPGIISRSCAGRSPNYQKFGILIFECTGSRWTSTD